MSVQDQVADRYRSAALHMLGGETGCCGGATCGSEEYAEVGDLATVSLGCGNPTVVADLHPGETVLDLGSGAGLDVILSARRVAPGGRAIGLDMTAEMVELARRNAAAERVDNVELIHGHIEDIPLPDDAVDVVISNCVINLSVDKPSVFTEMARVLRPGGRIGIADIVAEDRLSPTDRAERGEWAGCIAGALSVSEYRAGLTIAGFTDIEVTFTSTVADGLHNTIVRARVPPIVELPSS